MGGSIIPCNRTFRREGAMKVGRGTGGVFRTGCGEEMSGRPKAPARGVVEVRTRLQVISIE